MFSVENPPSDPSSSSCLCQHLNSNNNTPHDNNNKVSHNHLALPEVDLLKPPLDHLPKFSIRDYVLTSRSKDIKKNWPFSLKHLQLCLKHGVKQVLPPIQAIGAVKTQSFKTCTVETSSFETTKISNFDGEPFESNNIDAQLNHKLAKACVDTSSCRSGGENNFPSTTTSVSQSELEYVPTQGPSSSPLETDTSLEVSASTSATIEVEASANPTSHKTENTLRLPGKKCRLIVKFGGNSDRSSTEDIASNSTAVSETMASKVCPVCKTFSSSSNTTLNAHIDQCLSAESAPKWTADSKLTRHRIKPRKTRMMVDIYTTAKRCTLEELDRRNGTTWATISSLPTQDTQKLEIPNEVKRKRLSNVYPEDAGEVGEVYIDSNGTKVRILSKSNDAPTVSKVVEDLPPSNTFKGDKGSKFLQRSKFLSTKKIKRHARKHLKYLKLTSQSRNFFSHKACASEISGGQEGYYGVEESGKKEKHQLEKQKKSSDCGTLRQWVCSKRTGLAKKVISQDNNQPFGCKWHLARDLLVDSDQLSLGESLVERNRVQKYANLSENLLSSEVSERSEKQSYKAQASDKCERSFGRKRGGGPSIGASISDNMEMSLPPMKHNGNKSTEEIPLTHVRHTFEPSNSNRNCVSSLSYKRVGNHGASDNDSDVPPSPRPVPSLNSHAFALKALAPLSRKSGLTVRRRSFMVKSRPNTKEKCSARKKTQLNLIGDEGAAAWRSEVDRQYALMCNNSEDLGREEITDKTYFCKGAIRGIRQDRGAISNISQREGTMAMETSQPTPHCYDHDDEENTDPSARVSDDHLDMVDVLESVEGTVMTMGKSVDTKFHKLGNHLKTQSNSFNSVEDYNGMLCGGETLTGPTEPRLVERQEMYCSDEVGNDVIGKNERMGTELDTDIRQGNSFAVVDPIPIPGPPGSFLPSPRDMGSDDFQGNSSLTTSRVQSSQDQLDLVDGDSSDSPISATSTISNSTAAGSNLKYSESLSSVGAHDVQDKRRSFFFSASIETSVKDADVVPQTGTGAEKSCIDGEKFKVNKIYIEKRPPSFKNDGQPCCCQRKERISQDIAPDFQESQLLKRRTMASMTLPAMGKQIGCSPNARPNNLDPRPETFSPSTCTNLGSEKILLPLMKPATGPMTLKGSPEAGVKFLSRGDCDSASPSTPNPILRLMGKNLMVVNKEEDASVPAGQSQPCTQNSHVTLQFPTSSGVSPGNMQNRDRHSFQHVVPQGPVIFGHNPYDAAGQSFDVRLSSGSRNHNTNPRTSQTPVEGPAGQFPSQQHVNGGFSAAMEPPHMYEGAYSLSSGHNRPRIRLGETCSYSTEKAVTSPQKNAESGSSVREIIVIDDVPEREANVSGNVARYCKGLRASEVMSSGISIPTVGSSYSVRNVNPFPCYDQSQDTCVAGESANRRPSASPIRWSCVPECSGVLQQQQQRSPFMAASSPTGHLRSVLYYSPS